MLNFKELDDNANAIEQQIGNLTNELDSLREAIRQIKEDYQKELGGEKIDMPQYIIEKAQKRFEEYDKSSSLPAWCKYEYILAKNLSDEIDLLYARSKRKLKKDSVVLQLKYQDRFNNVEYFFCTDRFFGNFGGEASDYYDDVEIQYKDIQDILSDNGLEVELISGEKIAIHGDASIFMFITDILDVVDIAEE